MRQANVLVVDDSTFIRRAVIRMLGAEPRLKVVGEASTGREALARLAELPVDAVVLDLEMPELDGLATLQALAQARPVPVVVFSSIATGGAAVSLQALELGAFDVVAKPAGGPMAVHAVGPDLIRKLLAATGLEAPEPAPAPRFEHLGVEPRAIDLIVLGISTGGPPALQHLVQALPADFPVPMVVLQHMPPGYTGALAERLDRLGAIAVQEAADGDLLLPGRVLVAPSGFQLGFRRAATGACVAVTAECPLASYYRPCVDWSFQEAARVFGPKVLGVVMTGMGTDGARGVVAIKDAGGRVWAQDRATSTIDGMPAAARATGRVDEAFPLDELAPRLVAAFVRASERKIS